MNKDLNITHKEFIEKYNQAVDEMLPLPSAFRFFLRKGIITLREKLHIFEVEGAEKFESEEGLNITIGNSDLYLFFVVTINKKSKKLTKVMLNCKLSSFSQEKMMLMFSAVKAIVSALEDLHIDTGKESRDLIENLGLTDMSTEDKYHFRNGIAYRRIIPKDLGFCFIAESSREDLLDKMANNLNYTDYDESDLLLTLKSNTDRIKKQRQELLE